MFFSIVMKSKTMTVINFIGNALTALSTMEAIKSKKQDKEGVKVQLTYQLTFT